MPRPGPVRYELGGIPIAELKYSPPISRLALIGQLFREMETAKQRNDAILTYRRRQRIAALSVPTDNLETITHRRAALLRDLGLSQKAIDREMRTFITGQF